MIPKAEPVLAEELGARPLRGGAASFVVWAPGRRRVEAVFEGGRPAARLGPGADGYFRGVVDGLPPGALYRFRLDDEGPFPDPASRFQPRGPHGPSELVDLEAFRWRDAAWPGLALAGQVFYEIHVGTFTPEGTWDAAAARLPELARLGVTALQVMPVAEFPGRFGWGYDGVDLFAPFHGYGRPERFQAFVDAAHGLGLGVLLDVVYNHLGPDGNYLTKFSPDYFSRRHKTDWGDAVNYDGPGCEGVRRLVCDNAAYWIRRFHLDGLRVDATQSIFDSSPAPILAQISRSARLGGRGRRVLVIAENEPQNLELVKPRGEGGQGFDAVWNDDFHHSAFVALTGRREAYYTDYTGSAQELVSCARWGTLYQGQWYLWQSKKRGVPSFGLPAWRFVNYLENHDQIANTRARGERLSVTCSPGRYRAMSALLLLAPQTPLLFQGQERGARTPFHFFADHKPGLREAVFQGRRRFMAQFSCLGAGRGEGVPDPADEAAFRRCVVGEGDSRLEALYRDLLALRRQDEVFGAQDSSRLFGAVLGRFALLLRFFGEAGDDRLLLVNLGEQLALNPAPEPLLAPPKGEVWAPLWSSEEPRYGGAGVPPIDEARWELPAESAMALRPAVHRRRHVP